jgi:hypothetical protein
MLVSCGISADTARIVEDTGGQEYRDKNFIKSSGGGWFLAQFSQPYPSFRGTWSFMETSLFRSSSSL